MANLSFFTTKEVTLSHTRMGVAILTALILSACANKPTYQPNNNTRTTPAGGNHAKQGVPQRYQVQRGDTVSKIAARYGLNWREVSRINRLDSNHTIRVGQWLTLWGTSNPAQAGTSTSITQSPIHSNTNTNTTKVITVKTPWSAVWASCNLNTLSAKIVKLCVTLVRLATSMASTPRPKACGLLAKTMIRFVPHVQVQ